MRHPLRSAVCTEGRRMAGARALWVANGMKREQFGKPIIAIATQLFYLCLHDLANLMQMGVTGHELCE